MPLLLFLLCSGNTNLRVSGDWVEIPKHFSTLSVEVTCNATLQTTVCSVGLSLGTSVRPSESRINVSSYSDESATPGHLLHCSTTERYVKPDKWHGFSDKSSHLISSLLCKSRGHLLDQIAD